MSDNPNEQIENENSFQTVQNANLELLNHLSNQPAGPTDALIVDITKLDINAKNGLAEFTRKRLNVEDISNDTEENKRIAEDIEDSVDKHEFLQRVRLKESLTDDNGTITMLNPEQMRTVIVKQRTNLREQLKHFYPDDYGNYPYLYQFEIDRLLGKEGSDTRYLDNGVAKFVNDVAVVLAEADLTLKDGAKKKYLYVATGNVIGGWMAADDVVDYKAGQMLILDPIRPIDNLRRCEEAGKRLGVITDYLRLDPTTNRIVPVDPKKANAKVDLGIIEDPSNEDYGDGISETGETSLLSLGDAVVVDSETATEYVIIMPDGNKHYVPKEYLHIGYFNIDEKDSVEMLMNKFIDWFYSWGSKDGIGHDCSGLIEAYAKLFGIYLPRGAIGQGMNIEDKITVYATVEDQQQNGFVNNLPVNINDLKNKGIDTDNFPWGLATISWGSHIMIMMGVDQNGDIIYYHSVGPQKVVDENGNIDSYNRPYQVIKGIGTYSDDEGNILTFSPSLTGEQKVIINRWILPN